MSDRDPVLIRLNDRVDAIEATVAELNDRLGGEADDAE